MDEERLRIRTDEPLERGRLAVALRAVVVLPQLVVLAVWAVLATAVLVAAWAFATVTGRVPERLRPILAGYLRYSGQVNAWFHLLSARRPAPRRAQTHSFAIDVPEVEPQRRAVVLLRPFLALPALLLASVLRVVFTLSAVAAWFTALALGRTTAGLQELGVFCLRYELEAIAYLLLLTPRYPRLAPA